MFRKAKLSRNLLAMKFMKRSKDETERQLDDAERKELYKQEITEEMIKNGMRVTIEPSYKIVEDLVFGRMSFGGMNPEVEKIMKKANGEPVETEIEANISNSEMAATYGSLVAKIGKRFNKGNRTAVEAEKKFRPMRPGFKKNKEGGGAGKDPLHRRYNSNEGYIHKKKHGNKLKQRFNKKQQKGNHGFTGVLGT
ncbi:M-phase phosphoprotein 6-like [Artemia franciscana]|uniref:M-phase phosphoprotein 6 n=1 Tax=Artemia franciscana TaxID=6661 RepID=A0AA88H0H9_ARTSF|nr:hypothetical protein QYM36_020009 [Artemia franciscana]